MKNLKRLKNRYYLIRHGESLANRRGLIVSQPQNALNGYGLTALGAEQVTQAALSTRLTSDTIIVSSDYKRATETAEIMHSALACEIDIEFNPLLRERDFGDWELSDHVNYESVWQNDINTPDRSINNVEPVSEVLKRSIAAVEHVEKNYQGQKILLVGHGDVLQVLLSHHHNINPRFHRSLSAIGNADIRSLAKLNLVERTPAA